MKAIQGFFCSLVRQALSLWIDHVSLEVWLTFSIWLLGQSQASLETVPHSWVFYSKPNLAISWFLVWMILGFIRFLPDHAKLKGVLLPNCNLNIKQQKHSKIHFYLRFQYRFAFTSRGPVFTLVSVVTLYNMCHAPVSAQCISKLNHLAHSLLHDRSARVCVKICVCWSLSQVESH